MNSSYNYGNTESCSFDSEEISEEYNYYATENLQHHDINEGGKLKKTIEMLLLSNTID